MAFVATEITIKNCCFFLFVRMPFVASIHFLAFSTRSQFSLSYPKKVHLYNKRLKYTVIECQWNDIAQYSYSTQKKQQLNIKRKFTFSNYFVIGFYYCLSFIIDNSFPTLLLDGDAAAHSRGSLWICGFAFMVFEFRVRKRGRENTKFLQQNAFQPFSSK